MGIVQEIKEKLDIIEVVSGYVPLQKAGRSFKSVCPFHTEKTPSFFVFPERQTWHCFGSCGTGGDVFAFLMRKEGIDFGEALRKLAAKAGVLLEGSRREDKGAEDRLQEANESAARFFHNLLVGSSVGAAAREYLSGRGLAQRPVQEFMLGYSPESREALGDHLRERGFHDDELVEAGLLIRHEESGAVYDRFRGRVMFPIRDERGRTVGFGARAMDGSQPKYLNSPKTPIFDKGKLLYGFDRAREQIRQGQQAVVVEGYMDVLAAHEHGFRNVVASMGTSLTDHQVGLLRGLAKEVVLSLDADAAGEEATLRGIEVVRDALAGSTVSERTARGVRRYRRGGEAEIKVVALPRGRDPDDIIRSDPDLWQELVASALPVMEHRFRAAEARFDLKDPAQRSEAAEELLRVIGTVEDPVRRSHYLQRLSRLVQVDERTLQERLASARRQRRQERRPPEQSGPAKAPGDALEEFCLALLVHYPQLLTEQHGIAADDFIRSENREVFLALVGQEEKSLQALVEAGLGEHIEEIASMSLPEMDLGLGRKALAQTAMRLCQRRLQQMKAQEGFILAEEASERAEEAARVSFSRWRVKGDGALDEDADEIAHLIELQEKGMELNARLKEVFQRLDGKTRMAEV